MQARGGQDARPYRCDCRHDWRVCFASIGCIVVVAVPGFYPVDFWPFRGSRCERWGIQEPPLAEDRECAGCRPCGVTRILDLLRFSTCLGGDDLGWSHHQRGAWDPEPARLPGLPLFFFTGAMGVRQASVLASAAMICSDDLQRCLFALPPEFSPVFQVLADALQLSPPCWTWAAGGEFYEQQCPYAHGRRTPDRREEPEDLESRRSSTVERPNRRPNASESLALGTLCRRSRTDGVGRWRIGYKSPGWHSIFCAICPLPTAWQPGFFNSWYAV